MRSLTLVLITVGVMVGMTVWISGQTKAAPAQAVGCPACHGSAAGKEPALDAVAKKIKNHPTTVAKTVTQCALCHTKGPTPAPFRTALHRIHLNSSKFASTYKGTCTSCHSVDKSTGTVTVYGLEK